jgi:hypothetical protein
MKPSYTRRHFRRSRSASRAEGTFFKKEGEPAFFDTPVAAPFFNATTSAPVIQRKCEKCEEEQKKDAVHAAMKKPDAQPAEVEHALNKQQEKKKDEDKKLDRKESGSGAVTATSALTNPSGGTSMTSGTNSFFSRAIGHNFSNVKIHTGQEADRAAKAVSAKAYTVGNHIVFADGQYQPDSYEGKKLLAHELTHVVQQSGRSEALQRKVIPKERDLKPTFSFGVGSKTENKEDMGGCNGVASLHGKTKANYANSYTASGGTPEPSTGCTGCKDADCITISGTVDSVFTANPKISLPSVPGGLSKCEQAAVKDFINTTLAAHEQQHVDAFNTYVGNESTSYTYTGCKSGLKKYEKSIHDGVEVPRRNAANAASAALDPFNATIPCDCD